MIKLNLLGLLIFDFIWACCTSTKIVSSWRNQNNQIALVKLKKVLVVALFKDETSNRKAEN